jgi:hypothetical protein
MIYRRQKPNALPIKHLHFFCTQENTQSTSVFCSMFWAATYYRTQSVIAQYPFKFTVKGVKSVVTAPTRIDSL